MREKAIEEGSEDRASLMCAVKAAVERARTLPAGTLWAVLQVGRSESAPLRLHKFDERLASLSAAGTAAASAHGLIQSYLCGLRPLSVSGEPMAGEGPH